MENKLWRNFAPPLADPISILASKRRSEIDNPTKMTAMIKLVDIDDVFRSLNRQLLGWVGLMNLTMQIFESTIPPECLQSSCLLVEVALKVIDIFPGADL